MRTSMNLPDALLAEAKERAVAQGRTVTSLVEEALRALLADQQPLPVKAPLISFGRPGGSGPAIDLDDRAAVWAALDAERR